jgi:hypothetical protein
VIPDRAVVPAGAVAAADAVADQFLPGKAAPIV